MNNNAVSGESHWKSKLTEKMVKEIRRLHKEGFTQASIGRYFGVERATIYKIIHGLTWTHVDEDGERE